MPRKILIISPKFPIPTTGACEQERMAGFLQLRRLGFEIRIISKIFDWQSKEAILEWGEEHGIAIDLVPYETRKNITQRIGQILNPIHWDGAAYEYRMPRTWRTVKQITDEYKPDIAWFDYTYLYPLYSIVRAKRIPIITRSINIEPTHFLQEDGPSVVNLIKFLPKWYSELITIRKSDYVFAITPKEEAVYRKLGAKQVATLPLRSLPGFIKQSRDIKERDVLHLFFMGASYNVHHNRKAAEMVIRDIAPEVERRAAGKFFFHILGKKLPKDLSKLCHGNIKEEGFVDDLESFFAGVDIAVIPSLMGAGMQQKIFEPLARGIPTVTSERGIAGYPFKHGVHVLFAGTSREFVESILELRGRELRRKLSANVLALSQSLFSQDRLDEIIMKGIQSV